MVNNISFVVEPIKRNLVARHQIVWDQAPQIIGNKTGIPISWHVDQKTMPGHIIYCGRLDGQNGCGKVNGRMPFAYVIDPKYLYNGMGQVIKPNGIGNGPDLGLPPAGDPTRVRTDGLGGINDVDFGMPYAVYE